MSALDVMPRQDDVAIAQLDHLLPSRRTLWMLRALCGVGLSVSGYLAWTAFNSTPVYGCSGEVFNCGHVLTSAWSKWFGIPVGAPAFGLYASLLMVLGFLGRQIPKTLRVASWQLLTAGAIAAGLAAIWFIGLQVFVIEHLCVYCLAAHACGMTLAAYVLWNRPLGNLRTAGLSLAGAFSVAVLALGQVFGPAPQTFTVEHFDSPPVSPSISETGATDELIAAPGTETVFDAPGVDTAGEVFDAPGELFDAPVDEPAAAVKAEQQPVQTVENPAGSVTEPSKEQASDDRPAASSTDDSALSEVAATLLMIVPSAVLTAVDLLAEDTAAAAATKTSTSETAAADTAAATESTSEEKVSAETASEDKASEDKASEEKAEQNSAKEQPASTNNDANASDKPSDAEKTSEAAKTPEPVKPEPRIVSVSGNLFRLNAAQWPLLGKPDAKYIFVEMFDYTCPHCRNTHSAIHGAFQKYGKDLAVVALVVPLHPSCNSAASGGNADACELARLSIAVWRVKPDAFMTYHDWMFSAGRNRTSFEARQYAEQLVGRDALQKELSRKTVGEYIARHVELYKKVGSGSVPKIMFPKSTMTGEVGSTSSLQMAIQREFGNDTAVSQ